MCIDEFEEQVAAILSDQGAKLWIARQDGHRLDFIWSRGAPQTYPPEKLAAVGAYFLIGQHVPINLREPLADLFQQHFAESAGALRS